MHPQDEQHLALLFPVESAIDWEQTDSLGGVEELAQNLMQERALTAQEALQEASRIVSNINDPIAMFRGWLIAGLRLTTLWYFYGDPDLRCRLAQVPVGIYPTRELNGFAAPTPRGGAIIVLDSAIVLPLLFLIRSYWALSTWYSKAPACRDHSADSFAFGIIQMASPGRIYLDSLPTWECPSLYEDSHKRTYLAHLLICCRQFLLLHEYGHVALRHIGVAGTRKVKFTGSKETEAYIHDRAREYDADLFAIRCPVVAKKEPNIDLFPLGHFGWVVGILFRFFDLREALLHRAGGKIARTHPPAISRWKRLKQFIDHVDDAQGREYPVDFFFDEILRIASLPSHETRDHG